jgi:hypothetical protein
MRTKQLAAQLFGASRGRNLATRQLGDRRHDISLPDR